MNYNRTMIAGNITREIELRYTPSGTAVADISLAVNRKYKAGDETKEETTFVDVTLWGRTAEIAQQYSGKGKPLFVEGRLQQDTWQDKETGQKRSKLKVVADNIQLLNGRGDTNDQPPNRVGNSRPPAEPQRQAAPVQKSTQNPNQAELLNDGDDIPF